MELIQIPWSHNCIKVRRTLDLKGLAYEILDINPLDRSQVRRVSGQGLVPVLVDNGRVIADSTAILLYLEETYPDPPLVPREPELRAECLLLEDWADAAFMALTRRLAYWNTLATPGALETLFRPLVRVGGNWWWGWFARRAVRRRFRLSERRNRLDEVDVRRVASLAVKRLAGRDYLVGNRITIADIGLASMAAPLWAAALAVRDDPAVKALLNWGRGILGEDLISFYRPSSS